MFKFIETENNEDQYITYHFVSFNGVKGEQSHAYFPSYGDKTRANITIYDDELRASIIESTFDYVMKDINQIVLDPFIQSTFSSELDFKMEISSALSKQGLHVDFEMQVDFEKWQEVFSILSFNNELSTLPELKALEHIEYYRTDDDFVSNGFGFRVKNVAATSKISRFILENVKIIETLITIAKSNLENKDERVLIELNLAEEIRTPCEQYLMYFSQFLADLGINASSELSHDGSKTLFAVIPKDQNQALNVIADALASYLSLSTELDLYSQEIKNKDIALMQLESNVMHLKSQLLLANSVLEAKNSTIQSLKLSNEQYIVSTPSPKVENEENLIGDLVKVKEYKGKLISVDTPKILKKLKRVFRQKGN